VTAAQTGRRLAVAIAGASILLVTSAATIGLVATVSPTAEPADTAGPTGPPNSAAPAFAEECTDALRPEWSALHVPGDRGFGLDSDFLGDLRQVSVANGTCTITAARVATSSGRPYASAAMATRATFAQAYGTFEIRVRYPAGQGMWPAFWLLRDQVEIGGPPEIDIFEAYPGRGGIGGGSGPNVVVSSLHYQGGTHHFSYDRGSDMTADFHTHRLTWSPGLLVFSIDGVETGRVTQNVPDVAMYPIVNLAVGAPGFRADSSTPAVATMDIDYIRVWAQ